jgi:hypothetical protein
MEIEMANNKFVRYLVGTILFLSLVLGILFINQATINAKGLEIRFIENSILQEWSSFHYIFVPGSGFTPRASSTTWSYPGGGCVSAVTGNELFSLDLQLPQGARIDYLRLYYYDTSANNSTAWITTYDGSGGFTDLTNVSSTGNSGYGTTLSPLIQHVVDNASRAYVLNWQANQTGSTMRLCGLRVAYRLPMSQVFLPVIIN